MVKEELWKVRSPAKAKILSRFFKSGKGEYGEGDKFLGVTVPQQRRIARKYKSLPLAELETLLKSPIHEHRLTALIILTYKYAKADGDLKKEIVNLYLRNTPYINNWDLVDLTAGQIPGEYFFEKDKSTLYRLARSSSLWERRMAMIATSHFLRRGSFKETLKIARVLLYDKHDLIHKAVGWMLREVGKRNLAVEKEFLGKYYRKMPRVMLRYAIEKFSPDLRRLYLK